MSFSDALGIVGVVLGIASLIYAYYQTKERRKLEEFVRSQSWYVHSMANNMTGIAQASLRTYKQHHAESIANEVLEVMSKTDAFGQDLFKETIRQIQLSEPVFSKETISEWIADGKLDKDHAALFEQLCVRPLPTNKFWRQRDKRI